MWIKNIFSKSIIIAKFTTSNQNGSLNVIEENNSGISVEQLYMLTFLKMIPTAFFLADSANTRFGLFRSISHFNELENDLITRDTPLPEVQNFVFKVISKNNSVYIKTFNYLQLMGNDIGVVTVFIHFLIYLLRNLSDKKIAYTYIREVINELGKHPAKAGALESYNLISPITNKYIESLNIQYK